VRETPGLSKWSPSLPIKLGRRVKETVIVERVKPNANKSRIAIAIPMIASPKQTAKAVPRSTPETYNMVVIMA
jgi:hypothetical protein